MTQPDEVDAAAERSTQQTKPPPAGGTSEVPGPAPKGPDTITGDGDGDRRALRLDALIMRKKGASFNL